jgi:hypothetical protein
MKEETGERRSFFMSLIVWGANRRAIVYLTSNSRTERRENPHGAQLGYFQEREASPVGIGSFIIQVERRKMSEKNPHDA